MLAPSTIPDTYYLVCDFGKAGRETVINWEACSKADILQAALRGEYQGSLLEIHAIDRNDGRWSDVSEDMAREICGRVVDGEPMPAGDLFDFCERYLGCEHMANLAR